MTEETELPKDSEMTEDSGERIAKVLARAGVASRREAERMIKAGRITVDGKVLDTPAFKVNEDHVITVDGNPLPTRQPTRVWRYHKPKGLVTTHKDPQERPTVFEKLPKHLPRVISIGRLDFNTEGLLLLTNDGGTARQMELPANGWIRRYRVRVHGRVSEQMLAAIADGVTVEGVRYGPVKARLEKQTGANAWLMVSIKEGKNREVRKVFEHIGLTVNRLIRVAYGPFQLGGLAPGEVEEISGAVLKEQLSAGGTGKKVDRSKWTKSKRGEVKGTLSRRLKSKGKGKGTK